MTNWFVSKPQRPNLVSPNGFEVGGQNVFVPDPGGAGTMTLTQPRMLPPGWQAVNQIQWLSNNNTRGTGGAALYGRGKSFPRPHEQRSQPERGRRDADHDEAGTQVRGQSQPRREREHPLHVRPGADHGAGARPLGTRQAPRLLGQRVFRNGRVGDGAGMVWQKVPDVMEIALDPHEEAAEEVVQGLDEALRALGISRISPPGNTWFLIQADDLTAERAQKTDVMDPSFFVGLDDVSVREMSLSLLDILRLAVARARLTVLQMIGLRK